MKPPLVRSPCTSVCRIDARTGLCEGCLRTLDEIVSWSLIDDADKRAVWRLLRQRRADAREQPSPLPTAPAP